MLVTIFRLSSLFISVARCYAAAQRIIERRHTTLRATPYAYATLMLFDACLLRVATLESRFAVRQRADIATLYICHATMPMPRYERYATARRFCHACAMLAACCC